jgi:hypothetical protein
MHNFNLTLGNTIIDQVWMAGVCLSGTKLFNNKTSKHNMKIIKKNQMAGATLAAII